MLRTISWYVFLVVAVVIGLGAFGHGYSVRRIHEAIDQLSDPVISKTLYIVWYFVSGTMLVFGAMLVWIAFRLRAGDASALFVAYLIGALYLVTGICATIYRRGDPFWLFFILLGALLLGSSFALRAGQPSATPHAGQADTPPATGAS
ncbi:MAG TPA: hypothetical protein VJY15_01700 [Candidatus Acidoferrum sp.]|nr:hypothetical protein [Candidatus Acidoferrum sp.]